MRPLYKPTFPRYNFTDYDVIRKVLFPTIGAYCAYCEQPVSNDNAVEHKVPKAASSGLPDYQAQWRNLLLSCQSCNSAKGSRPDKRKISDWENMDEEDLFLDTLNLWVWPDTTAATSEEAQLVGDETYLLFKFVRDNRSQKDLLDAGLLRKYWNGKNVPAAMTQKYTMTWIVPNDQYIDNQMESDELYVRVKNTIANLNLNRFDPTDVGFNDRRVVNREAVYQAATQSLSRLETVFAKYANATDGPAAIRLLMQSIRQTALATGFWSVWFGVFRAALDNPPSTSMWSHVNKDVRKELLVRILVYWFPNEQNGKNDVLIFPGTDVSRLHMEAFQ